MKRQHIIGYLVKRYKLTLGEASQHWNLLQPEPTENVRLDNISDLEAYCNKLEEMGGKSFAKKEDKPMAKEKNNGSEIEGLLEKYNSIEDSAAKAKIRRQLRKLGYFLSKQGGGETPAPKVEIKTQPKEKYIPDGGGIMVTIKKQGETLKGFVIPTGTSTITIEIN